MLSLSLVLEASPKITSSLCFKAETTEYHNSVAYKSRHMEVSLKYLTGVVNRVEAEASSLILELKTRVTERIGIPVEQQRLVSKGND